MQENDFFESFIRAGKQSLAMMKKVKLLDGKEGCFVSIYNPSKSPKTSILTFLVGDVLHPKSQRYHDYSLEKPKRSYEKGHATSFESRDEDLGQWGGGFYLTEKGFGVGVSGFTEEQDMVFAILVAFLSNSIDLDRALEIAKHPPGNGVLNMLNIVLSNP